jgi:hypothetical protein
MREILIFAFVATIFSSAVSAGNTSPYVTFTGQSLIKVCDNYGKAKVFPVVSRKQGICEGYIFGVVESVATGCIPEATEKLTIVSAVRNYIKRDESRLSESGSKLVEQAILDGWKCKNKM